MRNIRPTALLIKPRLNPGNASECEQEALRFLKSWKRARERLAIQRGANDAKKIAQPKPKRSHSAGVA